MSDIDLAEEIFDVRLPAMGGVVVIPRERFAAAEEIDGLLAAAGARRCHVIMDRAWLVVMADSGWPVVVVRGR